MLVIIIPNQRRTSNRTPSPNDMQTDPLVDSSDFPSCQGSRDRQEVAKILEMQPKSLLPNIQRSVSETLSNNFDARPMKFALRRCSLEHDKQRDPLSGGVFGFLWLSLRSTDSALRRHIVVS